MHAHHTRPADPLDLIEIDSLLTPEERAIRDSVRAFCDRNVEPHVAQWFEHGSIDDIRGLTKHSANSACSACTSTATAAPG